MTSVQGLVLLVLVSTLVSSTVSIKGGQVVPSCDYPGLVAVLIPGVDAIICSGYSKSGILYLPELCGMAVQEISQTMNLLLVYGDGTNNITLPGNVTGTLTNGVFQMALEQDLDSSCSSSSQIYSGQQLDMSSCRMAGYGGDSLDAKIYDGVMTVAPLTKITSAPCCRLIFDSLNSTQKGVLVNELSPYNCVTSSSAACGLGDIGSPVLCQEINSGDWTVVGLIASAPCEAGGQFLLHDLTGSQASFKLGYSS